ncbi:DUF882 domain-containing protein [Enhydrobacter sp.]|uniref:DUF882 domain-containing protein n=1 Tax=Enhydrobacter sp. TaxID=1894999 RepID=UPI0026129489|nr:DUF882 domain-containing protein [Enhydrobacter sp.]
MAILLAFVGTSLAQTTTTGVSETRILRGTVKVKPTATKAAVTKPTVKKTVGKSTVRKAKVVSARSATRKSAAKKAAATKTTVKTTTAGKPAVATSKTSTTRARSASRVASKSVVRHVTPQSLRGSRYGGFAPSAPIEPPPPIDMTVPRSLAMTNVNSGESISVTYWSNGTYHRDALDQLNHFLRDVKTGEQTEMDPLLFDVLWQTLQITGFHGTVEVLSGYRSPETNAWLASVSAGVARDSQHMNGNAMDIRLPGVPVSRIRQAARSLQMGGVGYYPRSGFVHIDTGPVRYW